MNDYMIFFGLGVLVGALLSLSAAVTIARRPTTTTKG